MLLYISIGVGILIFVLRSLYVAFLSSLRDIPGPWLAKFTDTWRAYHAWRGNLPQVLKKAQAQYGDVIRIGPNCVSVSEKGQFETILGTKQDYVKVRSLPQTSAISS